MSENAFWVSEFFLDFSIWLKTWYANKILWKNNITANRFFMPQCKPELSGDIVQIVISTLREKSGLAGC